jgi:hypothetical protein
VTDIFISYAHQDRASARQLAEKLGALGFKVWWDREILPSQDFDREIESALARAKSVLVIWSPQTVESRWVRTEASEALDQRKLVPLTISGCVIPLEFRRIQTAQLMGWNGDATHAEFLRLVAGIKSLTRQSGPSESRSANWSITSRELGWRSVKFTLAQDAIRHSVEYRNNFDHEAIYLNASEICRGGRTNQLHPSFQFYIAGPAGPSTCTVEPYYGLSGRLLTGRVTRLKVSLDGKLLAELSR